MSGAFGSSFAGDGRAKVPTQPDPSVVAACADQPAEAAVIGALLRDETLIDPTADKLRSEDFADVLLGQVYGEILALHSAKLIATPITVAQRLVRDDELVARGGAKYLAQLGQSDRADRGAGYVDHLVDLSRRRFLATATGEIRPQFADTSVPIDDIMGQMEGALSGAMFWTSARPAIGIAQAWDSLWRKIRVIKAGEEPPGTTVPGLREWDEICGGAMMPGQLIILAARPGMGKTALALNIARRAASGGHGVLFISREMPVEQLLFRYAADVLYEEGSSATLDDLLFGRVDDPDFRRAATIAGDLVDSPLVFEEPETLNASRIGSLVRRHQRDMAQRGTTLKLVVVDYLQLLSPPENRGNREQEVSDISRELKHIARSCGITVLALAQLNRAVEQREDKHPGLSDLRDSGAIEQDADTVIFAFRAEYYLKMAEPAETDEKRREAWQMEMEIERDRLEIYSAKVRQGSTAKRRIYFFGKHQAVRGADHFRGGWGAGR